MHNVPRVILFDHDGLLVETEVIYYEAVRDALAELGITLTQEHWAAEYLSRGRRTSEIVAELGLAQTDSVRFAEERNKRYYPALEMGPPLSPYVDEVLGELKGRYLIGLVTGNTRHAIETVHRNTGFLKVFDLIVTSEDFERPKPYPDSYKVAAERLSVSPEQCVAVEDSRRGMNAALDAGIRCVVVPGVLTRGQSFDGALAVLPSLRGLTSLLATMDT